MLLMIGCTAGSVLPPVDRTLAESIETGSQLADAESVLGPAHAPSSAQKKQIAGVLSRMREQTRQDAERDKTLAWGNDEASLVVKVNAEGVIWVVSKHFGGARPPKRSMP